MANLSHSESRRMYSWWWDSHNAPKNSKWLQDNLTEIDGKVKSMIKLIEEDADSFARRAEMYYKKRPELMKLVEEFYRAYRALAERYNHATGELRHAQQTIAKAFPDEVPFELVEDLPSKSTGQESGSHTPTHPLFNGDDLLENLRGKKGLKQLAEMLRSETSASHNQNLEDTVIDKIERAKKAENEVQCLKKALADMEAEKEKVIVQYRQCLEKLSEIEGELNNAQNDSARLSEKASRAEIEVQTLKEALVQFEVKKIAAMIKQNDYLEKISHVEAVASRFQDDMKDLDSRAVEAESEAQHLKNEISKLELEKEMVVCDYTQCLGKISDLEKIISSNEDEARLLKERAEIAETEVFELQRAVVDLNKQKEYMALQLEKISELERDLSIAQNDIERLNNEVLTGNAKLKMAEGNCTLMETFNQSLRAQADNLTKKIAIKDQELTKKQEELEKLETCLQGEHSRCAQVEAALETLQNLHSRSQDDQRALAEELNNMVRVLKDMETSKIGLEEEVEKFRDEHDSLSRSNSSSAVSMENMQNEILDLCVIRQKLENEVLRHAGVTISLQKEISCLKEEIKSLNKSYEGLVEQVEAAGLNPKFVETSMKGLRDENSKLRQKCEEETVEKALLCKKIEEIEDVLKKKMVVETSISDLNAELVISRGEKAALVAEKASLLSQLQAMTENMQNLLGNNAVLEDFLSSAKVELQGLRERSKGLEEICELLKNERSYLLSERGTLVLKLENVEKKLNGLEKQFTGLEAKYADLEKEKEAMHCRVKELKVSLCEEKRERKGSQLESETRLAGLENQINNLQEENRWKKKESEEEIDKALKAQFEISVLQKFIKDMEEKNCSLIIECQKHVEASKLAEKLISELEGESLEQQVEAELLLDEIERLRLGIYQIFRVLENDQDCFPEDDKVENEQTFVNHILGSIEDLKCCVSEHEDEKQHLVVENSVLLALLEQLESKGVEIESQKINLEQGLKIMAEKLVIFKREKDELLEMNRQLKLDVNEGHREAAALKAEFESLSVKQTDLHNAYDGLEEAYARVNRENMNLLKKFSDLKAEKYEVDQHNDVIILELFAMANESAVLRSFGREKVTELKLILEKLSRQCDVSNSLENEMNVLREKLDSQKAENLDLKEAVCRLERERREMTECNVQMNEEIINGKESLNHTEAKLLDTQMKLESAEKLNSYLKIDIRESLQIRENLEKNVFELSENNSTQKKEIESLHLVNKKLKSEINLLRQEMEENTVRERTLSTELQEMSNEFEMFEAEASTFCFDLQVSSIQEVLLKNKVQELTGVCETLDRKHAVKMSDIERMKEKICLMENEVSGLKSQLHAYAPVVASLRDDIAILEHNALLHKKLKAAHNQETELLDVAARPSRDNSEIPLEDQSLLTLQNLQMRVKAVGKLIEETNKPVLHRRSNSDSSQESTVEIDLLKPRGNFIRKKGRVNETKGSPKLRKLKSKARNGMLMKDIPLDQVSNNSSRRETQNKGKIGSDDLMLELWETAAEDGNKDQIISGSLDMPYKLTERDNIVYDRYENLKNGSKSLLLPLTDSDVEKELAVDKLELSTRKTEPNREINDAKILEKLTSDAQKLEILQTTLRNLRRKLELNKKSRKAKSIDFESIQEQLQEAEDTVVHLVDLNGQLVKNIEDCPKDNLSSPRMKETVRTWRVKVMEQAQKGSERIERLHLGLQKIQYALIKMEDEKKNKGKNKFLRSKTIILRDFIDNGRKNSAKRKKGPRCGCFRQSTNGIGNSS